MARRAPKRQDVEPAQRAPSADAGQKAQGDSRPFLTLAQAAERLGLSYYQTYRARATLPGIRLNNRLLFPAAAIERWIEQKAVEALAQSTQASHAGALPIKEIQHAG